MPPLSAVRTSTGVDTEPFAGRVDSPPWRSALSPCPATATPAMTELAVAIEHVLARKERRDGM